MFGIGLPELIIIMVVALIVIGPKKLPDLAKALGKGMAEFRKATEDIKESLDLEQDLEDVRGELADAVGDVNRPLDTEDLAGVEMPAYQDYDEVLEEHEEEMKKTSDENRVDSSEEEMKKTSEGDRVNSSEEEMKKTSEEDRVDSSEEDRDKDGA